MISDRQAALDYLRAPANGLWRWTENGNVLVWRDGSTIAFKEELQLILEALAANGLPSFGSIVFLLAGCRGKLPAVADIVKIANTPLPPAAGKDAALLVSARAQLKAQLEAALAQLAKLAQLPSELNSGVNAKRLLAEAVFEPAKAERYLEAAAVLRGLREPMSDAELMDREPADLSGRYIRQVHIVAQGLKPHTPASLALRLRTGLDALPKPTDASLPAAERARRLIEELSREREIGAVARAARELMAAVRLPRRLAEREQLAVGGVSDLTNRGPLDKLLLSELAHDDLTLSVRVALNEALYLRREPPMREPPGTLALLLDSSLRLWGVPRVLATAVALALIARDKHQSDIKAWRAHGTRLEPLDLLSREGMARHLEALELAAHPGEACAAFAKESSGNAQNQAVVITHADALLDPDFRRAISEVSDSVGFVATVDRQGQFALHALSLAHRPPICEADLDLATVFDSPQSVPLINREIEPGLPAIFGVCPFPFLLPVTGSVDCWVKAEDGFIHAILNDRRWVKYRDSRSGARVLASELPGGKTPWMDARPDKIYAVKASSSQRPARLLSLSFENDQMRAIDLAGGDSVLAVHPYGDALVVIRPHDIRAYSLSDGKLLDQMLNIHQWIHGRFFRGTEHFLFIVWDGARLKYEPVNVPPRFFPITTAIFDRAGLSGPWLLTKLGQVFCTETEQLIELPHAPRFDFPGAAISRDGHQIFALARNPGQHKLPIGCMFSFEGELTANPISSGQQAVFDRGPGLPVWNLYRIFEGIGKIPNGFALRGRRRRWRKLALDANGNMQIMLLGASEKVVGEVPFAEHPRKTKYGCSLQVAEFADGSQAFLDSRGLLHLKSGDKNLPEISLVLSSSEVAGWTSDGFVCGPSFFFEAPIAPAPTRIFEKVLNFFAGV